MTNDLSLGEVQSLALKAARGSGRSHGMAEEAGYCVRWLAERGYDGAGALAVLLQAPDAPCPLAMGAALSDAGTPPPRETAPVQCPLLLVPFLAGLCPDAGGLALTVAGTRMMVGPAGAAAGPAFPAILAQVDIAPCAPPETPARHPRARVDDKTLGVLTEFAARTYAPATEASRAKGAGAGLSDND